MIRRFMHLLVMSIVASVVLAAEPGAGEGAGAGAGEKPSLQAALAELQIPPAWLDDVKVNWDMNKPWKDGRLEIRRLLGETRTAPQGVKLTWLYAQKQDIADGHELPMYLLLSGNYAWALVEYEKMMKVKQGQGATHGYLALAALYAHYGEMTKAKATLDVGLRDLPPDPWRIQSMANLHSQYGDLCVELKDMAGARQHYATAIRLYPTSNQPYGKHLLKRKAAKVQGKLDLLRIQSLGTAKLNDGRYVGTSLGYSEKADVQVTVTIAQGRIADVQVAHDEKIELESTRIIPQRIIEKQSLQVDGVTGATVTSQAIIDGTYQALRKAGLK